MQDVGEHMDDLFRKAADNYMLKDGESNWNEIAGQLESSLVSPVPALNKNNPAGKYLVTAALLLLCFLAGIMFNRYASKDKATSSVNMQRQHSNSNADTSVSKENILSQGKTQLQQDKVVADNKNNKVQVNANTKRIIYSATRSYNKEQVINAPADENNLTYNNDAVSSAVAKDFSVSAIINNRSQITTKQATQSATLLSNKPVDIKQPLFKDSASGNAAIKLTVKNRQGMYYGLLAGAGFTTVKSQSLTRPGFDIGLVAGFQVSLRSSVEINLLYTHKYYYSDGRYFSMDKIKNDMPANMKLMSVKGNSSIIDIPVKFRYNVMQKNNSAVYAAAGVSSYILVNEKNSYVTSTNGTVGSMYGNYTSTSGYFAGALNISAGYAHTLQKNNSIRVEPYVTIPLKGIGMGSLPVTTSGVHVLFTIAAHK